MAVFVSVDQIEGEGCCQAGYAVPESYQGRGWAADTAAGAIARDRPVTGLVAATGRHRYGVEE
jgi:hypothetical protein